MRLPRNWCVQRTPQNADVVNGYLNKKNGYDAYYSKNEQKFVTSDTKKGGVAPSTKKPDGYTEITYEQFVNMVVNENTGGNSLPKFWAVKNDNSLQFKTIVIPYLNSLRGQKQPFSGEAVAYYGFDGEAKSCPNIEGFSTAVSEITVDVFIAATKAVASHPAAANGAVVAGGRAEPVVMPPVHVAPQRDAVTVDFKLIKAYPGMKNLGKLATTLTENPLAHPVYSVESEYWQPVTAVPFLANDYIVINENANIGLPAGVMQGQMYQVLSVRPNVGQPQQNGYQILTLAVPGGNKQIYCNRARMATPAEVDANAYPIIGGLRSIPTGNGTINIGSAAGLNLIQIEGMRSVLRSNPNSQLIIAGAPVSIELLDEVAEQLDE